MQIPQKPTSSTSLKSPMMRVAEYALAISFCMLMCSLNVSMFLREVRKSFKSDISEMSKMASSSCSIRLTANVIMPRLPTATTRSNTYLINSLGKLQMQNVMNHLQIHIEGSTPSSRNICEQSCSLARCSTFWRRIVRMVQRGKPSSQSPSSMYFLLVARCTNMAKLSSSEQPITIKQLTRKLMPCVQPILGKWLAMRLRTFQNCRFLSSVTGESKVRLISFSICTKHS